MKATLALILLGGVLLTGCSARALSDEQRVLRIDQDECRAEASDMASDDFAGRTAWRIRFELCMHNKGYTDAQLKQMWY